MAANTCASFIVYVQAPRDLITPFHEQLSVFLNSIHFSEGPGAIKVSVGDPSISDRDDEIRTLAAEQLAREGAVEIDEGAPVSEGGDNGAYVLAWHWLPFQGTPLSTL